MQANLYYQLKKELKNHLQHQKVLMCVGSKKCTGDLLGPLVGEYLTQSLKKMKIEVIGNMQHCLDYNHICSAIEIIYQKYQHPYLIIIDSAVAEKEYIGKIIITHSKVVLGNALGKSQYQIGNLGIKGIVAEKKQRMKDNFISLGLASEKIVTSLASNISEQIYHAIIE